MCISSRPGFAHRTNPFFHDFHAMSRLRTGLLSLGLLLLAPASELLAQQDDSAPPIALTYQWEQQYYGKINGVEALLYHRSFSRAKLSFADIDGDGDDDLFIGKADGRIAFFQNIGTSSKPEFRLKMEDFAAFHIELDANQQPVQLEEVIDVGSNAAPELVDIDSDGDLDLFIGSGDGSLFHYENRGNRILPRLFLKTPLYMNLKFPRNLVPRFADVNGDRNPDLLVGTGSGKVRLLLNSGVTTRALFCPDPLPGRSFDPNCIHFPQDISSIAPLIDASPNWVDWDRDGDFDIVVGKSNGRVNFLLNKGDRFTPHWERESQRFLYINTGGHSAPTFYDLDKDGFPELFLGSSTSRVFFFKNREPLLIGLQGIPQLDLSTFTLSDPSIVLLTQACEQLRGNPECLNVLAPAFGQPITVTSLEALNAEIYRPDVSLDSTPIAMPEQEAAIQPQSEGEAETPPAQANVNVAEGQPPADPEAEIAAEDAPPAGPEAEAAPEPEETKGLLTRNRLWFRTRNFLNLAELAPNERHTKITSGDWNGDGRADLLVGSSSGRIYAYENQNSETESNWVRREFLAFAPNQRRYSAPTLADLDGDGDLDVVVGNRSGRLELILNQGDAKQPNWVVTNVHFFQIDVGNDSFPALSDLDGDADLDLLVGNGKGLVILYENKGSKTKPQFILRNTRFARSKTDGYAAPALFHWNEDEFADLVVGQRGGLLQLYSRTPRKNAPASSGWHLESDTWQSLRSESYSTPHFVDVDNDKQTDLLMGDEEGHVLFWRNAGVQKTEQLPEPEPVLVSNTLEDTEELPEQDEDVAEPVVSAPKTQEPTPPLFTLVTDQFGGIQAGRRTTPTLLDLDGDNDFDLLLGNRIGELLHLVNEGGQGATITWTLATRNFLDYRNGRYSAPVAADLDGDDDPDLLVGSANGSIRYWENKGTKQFPDFIANPAPFLGVTGGSNAVPAVLDLNNDGYSDLLVGNFEGNLRQFIRLNGQNGFRFKLMHRRFLNLDVGLGAMPSVADLNNDAQPDLVVGSDRGQLISFVPANTTEQSSPWGWVNNNEYFKELKLPLGGYPAFADLDGDGDLDMLVGTESGPLSYYRNDAQ